VATDGLELGDVDLVTTRSQPDDHGVRRPEVREWVGLWRFNLRTCGAQILIVDDVEPAPGRDSASSSVIWPGNPGSR
jgi:hypothetical protein